MFSYGYWESWGCRCCSPDGGEAGGSGNTNWDLFSVEGCGATKPPTSLATPDPTSACFDYSRGGCWDLGYKDYLSDDEACKRYCELLPDCLYWSFHPLRGDQRCHVCSLDEDWSTCDEAGSCVWGPAVCAGEDPLNSTEIFYDSVRTAESYCAGGDALPSSDDILISAENLNELVSSIDLYFTESSVLDAAATEAAAVLAELSCVASAEAASPCNYAAVLMQQLRGFLLLYDEHSLRAFPDATDTRKTIWDAYRILIEDHALFNNATLHGIRLFFDDLPSHLLHDGVLFDAPFATMTAKDTFDCDGDDSAGKLLGFTNRGFNVFGTQIGKTTADAFPSDIEVERGDQFMQVLRHADFLPLFCFFIYVLCRCFGTRWLISSTAWSQPTRDWLHSTSCFRTPVK